MKEKLAELRKKYRSVALLGEEEGWRVDTKDSKGSIIKLTDMTHKDPDTAVEEAYSRSHGYLVIRTNT
jgi:hypothetical protein